jgi:hypothetical protein
MGGGLMQLVAYGAQDIYLTGNPQITFFKVVYRRHTNFSMESIQQTLDGSVGPCKKVSCTISRNGDLIHKMYIRIHHSVANCACGASGIPTSTEGYMTKSPIPMIPDTINTDNTVTDDVSVCANDLINSVEIEIGGQKIDKHYGDWLNIWTQLSTSASKNVGLEELLNLKKGKYSYVPLQFWFCRNPGLALPLIALQYHEVKLKIEFTKDKAGGSCNGAMCELTPDSADWTTASLWVDYIYLDTDERRRFAQVSHEYLIEQLQFTGTETLESGSSSNVRLNFNHPVKELIWRATGMVATTQTDKRTDTTNNPVIGYTDVTKHRYTLTFGGAATKNLPGTWFDGTNTLVTFPTIVGATVGNEWTGEVVSVTTAPQSGATKGTSDTAAVLVVDVTIAPGQSGPADGENIKISGTTVRLTDYVPLTVGIVNKDVSAAANQLALGDPVVYDDDALLGPFIGLLHAAATGTETSIVVNSPVGDPLSIASNLLSGSTNALATMKLSIDNTASAAHVAVTLDDVATAGARVIGADVTITDVGTPVLTTVSEPVYKHARSGVSGGTDGAAVNAGGNVCAAASWSDVTLQLNGHERFSERHSEYFRLVQPLQHHTSIPADSGIHVYSFALKPEEHQPSGTCNFSRIDNAVLKLSGMTDLNGTTAEDGSTAMSGATLRVYAVNYNVLRIMSGMGGLAYSN